MIQEKLDDEVLLNFPELLITEKHVKIRFKNRGSPCYFLSSRGQKIKDIIEIEQKRLFLFTFLVSFFMAFLAQKLIYTINIWFNFASGSFFEQDHLLNLIDDFFSLTLTVRGLFYRNDFKWKGMRGYGVNFGKSGSFASRT